MTKGERINRVLGITSSLLDIAKSNGVVSFSSFFNDDNGECVFETIKVDNVNELIEEVWSILQDGDLLDLSERYED